MLVERKARDLGGKGQSNGMEEDYVRHAVKVCGQANSEREEHDQADDDYGTLAGWLSISAH